jgi:hypothetical protein
VIPSFCIYADAWARGPGDSQRLFVLAAWAAAAKNPGLRFGFVWCDWSNWRYQCKRPALPHGMRRPSNYFDLLESHTLVESSLTAAIPQADVKNTLPLVTP